VTLAASWARNKVVTVGAATPVVPGSLLDHALRYAGLGWHIFPVWGGQGNKCRCGSACKSPGKHPVEPLARRGQDDATTDAAQIRLWWQQDPDAGIGVHLKPSGLCAIDIDPRNGGFETIDALESEHGALVSDVYQFTQGGGEHRLFKLSGDSALPGKLGPGVDVKRNGYIVLAPTQGVLGKYDWEASSDPLAGAIPSPLPDWIRDLQRPQEPAGGADLLGSRFATAEQVAELRDALAVLDANDRDTWVRSGLALRALGQAGWSIWTEWSQKSAKFDPVDQIRVWRSFKPSGINFESIFFAAQQAGWVNPLAGGPPPAVPAAAVAVKPAPKAPELRVFQLPGVLGQVEAWINATSRKLQPVFATQTAIAFGSVLFGRRYVTTQRNWSSLYLLNIGKSASGKEHGKWALEALLDACKLQHLIGPAGYTSDSGVLSSLHRQPAHVAIIDEFGKVLEAASIKHGARAASTLRSLMEVWARCDGTLRPQGYSTFGMSDQDADKIAEKSVINPALTLLGMTTPDTFFDTLGSAAARDGFLNRFLIVESDIGRQAGQHVPPLAVPEAIVQFATEAQKPANLIDAAALPSAAANAHVIPFTAAAAKAYGAFEHDCLRLMDEHDEDGLSEMFGRTCEMAMRLGLIVALGNAETSINGDSAAWAIDYVRYHAVRTAERLKTSVADSDFEAIKNQVLALIGRFPQGLTERELSQRSRRFRSLDMRGQVNVLSSLAFTADIVRVEFPPTSGRGSPRKAWVITADNADKPVSA
jgi:hypothetical protein